MIIVLLAVVVIEVSNRGFVMDVIIINDNSNNKRVIIDVGNRLNKDINNNDDNSCNDSCNIDNDNNRDVARNSTITRGSTFWLP